VVFFLSPPTILSQLFESKLISNSQKFWVLHHFPLIFPSFSHHFPIIFPSVCPKKWVKSSGKVTSEEAQELAQELEATAH
jgi:hypothetical protein